MCTHTSIRSYMDRLPSELQEMIFKKVHLLNFDPVLKEMVSNHRLNEMHIKYDDLFHDAAEQHVRNVKQHTHVWVKVELKHPHSNLRDLRQQVMKTYRRKLFDIDAVRAIAMAMACCDSKDSLRNDLNTPECAIVLKMHYRFMYLDYVDAMDNVL